MVKLCQHYLKSVQIDLIVVVHACVRRSATVGLRIEIYPQEKKQMYLAFATGNGGQMIEVLIIKSFKTSKKNWVKESTCDQN